MAEAIARRLATTGDVGPVEVRSAGVATGGGSPASGGALRAAGRHGLDLADHRSTPLTPQLLEWADLVLTMSPAHLLRVLELGGGAKAEVLTAYASDDGSGGAGVPDPFGGSDEEYEVTFNLLEELVERAFRRLAPRLSR